MQYDGTDLYGFQRQKDPAKPTVQSLLEQAGRELLGHPIAVVGAGRTDAGVHAVGQVAHFRTGSPIPVERIAPALNHRLPASVRVVEASEAPAGFHARRDATSRIYCYHVLQHPRQAALLGRFSLWWPQRLDVEAMVAVTARLTGRHRFDGFGSPTRRGATTWRTLYGCQVDVQEIPGGRWVRLCFEADAFLYRMVRRMVGALLRVGEGKLPAERVLDALEHPENYRAPLAPAVPARGLVLVHVHYGAPPAGLGGCGGILDTLSGLWLEWPRGYPGQPGACS